MSSPEATGSTAAGQAPPPAPPSPPPLELATNGQKLWLCIVLTVLSIATLMLTYRIIRCANELALVESTAFWQMPASAHLRTGPVAFHYDPDRHLLVHRGPLDAARQLELRDLLEFDGQAESTTPKPESHAASAAAANPLRAERASGSKVARIGGEPSSAGVRVAGVANRAPSFAASSASSPATAGSVTASSARPGDGASAVTVATINEALRTYRAAVDLLAFEAQDSQVDELQLLLYLGLLGGTLGALLRSFVDFVGNACYKNQLDLVHWWPLYATRPVVGAILGFLLVILFKAKLFTTSDAQTGTDSYWWLGVAALGGFSTIDVTARLRQAAKALFGGN